MSFSGAIQKYTDQYRKRMSFVAKTATLDVVNEARKPRNDGGRIPILTSNLQKSMIASTKGVPSGPSEGNENKNGDDVSAELIRWKPGEEQFWAGFTAVYARAMEARYGFMRGATERWPELVSKAVAKAKSKNL